MSEPLPGQRPAGPEGAQDVLWLRMQGRERPSRGIECKNEIV